MTFGEFFARLLAPFKAPPPVGLRDAAGPDHDEHPPVPMWQAIHVGNGATDGGPAPWVRGVYQEAQYTLAHPGRIGPTIIPKTVVVHTTDMHASQWGALRKAWTDRPGDGACAHFLIGRDASQGLVQFVPITRNGNHAGGKPHGWWKTKAGAFVHPNTVAVGIELHAAGQLKRAGDDYRHPDSGLLVPASDVELDAHGRAWHKVTDYQYAVLRQLLRDLLATLSVWPRGEVTVVPDATYQSQGVLWAAPSSVDVVGHVSLDPINRNDPGPFVMDWLHKEGF